MERNKIREDNKINLIKRYAIVLIISIAVIVVSIFMFNSSKKQENLNITESATVDYVVNLKNNDFYKEKYLTSNKQYISSLIKNITAKFNYNLNTDNDDKLGYTYRIDAILDINDSSTKKSLYTHVENLVAENKLESNNGKVVVKEDVKIDYQYFNKIANKFMSTYDLSGANNSTLKVNLYVKTKHTEESVVTLLVPLVRQTFDITPSNALYSQLMPDAPVNKVNTTTERISIIILVMGLVAFGIYTYKLIKHLLDNRSDEEKYKSSVKRILVNYGEYINKTDDFQFKLDEYEIVRVNTFLDLLKIKEDLSRPILMIENKEKTNAIFAITDNAKFIYMFALNMEQKKLAAKN